MTQIFDVHCIHGLPYTSQIKDLSGDKENYNIHTDNKSSVYDPVAESRFSAILPPVSYPSASSRRLRRPAQPSSLTLADCTPGSLTAVYIASNPAGAQIIINGIEQTGFHTPAMITDLPSGYNSIKLISPGYIEIESSIPLESGRTYNVFLTMEKVQAQTSYTSSGIIILLALGLGFLLLRNQKII